VLFQISEPGETPEPHQRKRAVGIDLGTTNSLVATVRSSIPEVLVDENGQALLPSIVHYSPAGEATVGYGAVARQISDALNTIASSKRLMGRGFSDVSGGRDMSYTIVRVK
jgi:molecular chaperone HscA